MVKTRRSYFHLIWRSAAVRHDVETKFTVGRFKSTVMFAFGYFYPVYHQFELVHHPLYTAVYTIFIGQDDPFVRYVDLTVRDAFHRLTDDLHTLIHLFETYHHPVISVSHGTHHHVEVKSIIIVVGVRKPQVIRHTACTKVRSRKAIVYRLLCRHGRDILNTVIVNSVMRDHFQRFGNTEINLRQYIFKVFFPTVIQVMCHTSYSHIRVGQPCACQFGEKIIGIVTRIKEVPVVGLSTHVKQSCSQTDKMVDDP